MKRLLIIRHAKSSWEDFLVKDIDRPLNERGFRDAPFMGSLLAAKGIRPDKILSSPALRAKTTAQIMAKELGYPMSDIVIRNDFYESIAEHLLNSIKGFDDQWGSVMMFGHNPESTSLANKFVHDYIPNIPTCGIVCVRFETDRWADISPDNAVFEFFDFPKKNITVISNQ